MKHKTGVVITVIDSQKKINIRKELKRKSCFKKICEKRKKDLKKSFNFKKININFLSIL